MTEFALIAPILIVLVFAVIQFGVAFNNYMTLTDAARAAARKGAVSRELGSSAATSACETAGYNAGGNLESPGTKFVVKCNSSWSAGSDVTVTATYPYAITLLDWVVYDGTLSTTMKERVE
jgi:Flp pilus assembly protein TadG